MTFRSRPIGLVVGSFAALLALTVLALLGIAAVVSLKPDLVRGQIESRAADAFGRRVTAGGPLYLKPSLPPVFVAEDLRIGNPDWASRPDLARVERLEVQVALLPLLRGELDVLNVVVQGADVQLEVKTDGGNNFTFGRREGPPGLPGIDSFQVQGSVIGVREAGGPLYDCEVFQARAVNRPGQSIELEGRIACRNVPIEFSLSAGTPEQFADATAPWPLSARVSTEGVSLAAEGRLPESRGWEEAELQVAIKAERVDSLSTLVDFELPSLKRFEINAGLKKSSQGYVISDLQGRIGSTDFSGQLRWRRFEDRLSLGGAITSERVHIRDLVLPPGSGSETDSGWDLLDRPIPLDWIATVDAELKLDVKQVVGIPVSIDNAAATVKIGNDRLTIAPWMATLSGIPVTGDFSVTAVENSSAVRFEATMEHLDTEKLPQRWQAVTPMKGRVDNVALTWAARGDTLRALSRNSDLTLETGGGRIGSAEPRAEDPWGFDIAMARIEAKNVKPITLAVDGAYRGVPVSLSLNTVTLQRLTGEDGPWPLALSVTAEDTSFVAEGRSHELGAWRRGPFQVSLKGGKVDAIDALFGLNLPVSGAFELSAELSKSEGVFSLLDLQGRIGSTDIEGELKWWRTKQRYVVSGGLSSRSLHLRDLIAGSDPGANTGTAFIDQPIPLDWVSAIDAELELEVQRVLGAPVPIRDVAATVELGDGRLSLSPLRAVLAGTSVTGNVALVRQRDVAQLNLSARSRRLDLADTLPQLGASVPIRGGLEDVTVTVNGRGRTLRTLSRQTALSLETRGGGITLEDAQGVPISTFELAEASLKAGAGQRVGMTLDGSFRDVPLKLMVETARLETLATAVSQPWPLEVSLQGRQFNLSATGSVAQPFRARGFELTFDMTGPDPSGVDSLLNFAIPLRGEYRIRGRFTDDASHYRLTDLEATIGQSDIRGSIAILMDDVRPWISAGLSSRVVNIEDLRPSEAADERAARVLPQYVIPVEALASTDLNFNFTAGQVSLHGNRLGNLAIRARNHGGVLVSSAQVTGLRTGARLTVEIQVNVNQNPPANRIALTARSVDYGQLLMDARMARSAQGRLDAEIDLAGPGVSLRDFLNRAEGQVRVQGGSGSIQSRELELWTSGLMRAMLPEGLGRESTVRLNCIVGHIDVAGGVAKTDKLLVDTTRVTIAGSGALNLGTERVDLLLSPNPRQARLVSFANPVRVTGTLTAPVVEVTKLPRLEFAATTGLLASLVNPAFLLLAFGDIGGGADNPCIAAVDRREAVTGAGRLPGGVLQRFRNLFLPR